MKLSIITINYNNKEGLDKTIASILSQRFRDFEWIIVDGGSNDGSAELIEEIANDPESNISYWCSEKDNGVYNAMNKGIVRAKGDYLNFMNSGDVFYDSCTLEKWSNSCLYGDIVYGNWIRRFDDHDDYITPIENGLGALIYFENICHQAMFIKRSKLLDGYDERYKIFSDWQKWQQLACNSASFQYVPQTICIFEAGKGLSENIRFMTNVNEQLLILDDLPKQLKDHILDVRHYEQYKNYAVLDEIFNLIDHRPIIEFVFRVMSSILKVFIIVKYELRSVFKKDDVCSK